jgi:hypothetical protein
VDFGDGDGHDVEGRRPAGGREALDALPYVHPLWQAAALALAVWALRLGLRMRALRRRRRPDLREPVVRRHARVGTAFVWTLGVGAVGGPLILSLVRGEPALGTSHAFFAGLAFVPLLAGAALGRRLRRGRGSSRDRDAHAFAMAAGLAAALLAGALGLGLLP